MDRKILAALGLVAIVLVANATVFAYRWFSGNLNVLPANNAIGSACTGFYTSAGSESIGIPLPNAGTNAFAPTFGGNTLSPSVGRTICEFQYGDRTYKLYESVSFTIDVTIGSWYFKDIYAFGYYSPGGPTVYVYLKVEDTLNRPVSAYMDVYKLSGGTVTYIGELNLKNAGSMISVALNPGEALRLDLRIDYTDTVSDDNFKVGFYVSQESESP